MPTPTIPDGELFMNATLYTGNGSTNVITNGVAGQSFQPDLVWVKNRNTTDFHILQDSVRGTGKELFSNATGAEESYANSLTSFNSNGFTLGSRLPPNNTGSPYVAWQWKAGGAAVTNTAGTISSQVSANTTSGFSIVTYTGTGSNGATVGHGLGVAPRMVIVKERGNANVWGVGSSSLTSWAYHLRLNSTNAESNADNFWNSTAPTSSVFTLGDVTAVNRSGGTYVAYCWTPIAGYSAFGSYTGNGSTDGPFIYTGFRPRFIMVKASSFSTSSTVWTLFDTSRSPYNASVNELYANSSSAEGVDSSGIDILSNGFKPRRNSEYANSSGQTYIYMAFCENPLKYANAR
jgi:hypothetical protein